MIKVFVVIDDGFKCSFTNYHKVSIANYVNGALVLHMINDEEVTIKLDNYTKVTITNCLKDLV